MKKKLVISIIVLIFIISMYVIMPKHIKLFNNTYSSNIEILDLSNVSISNEEDLIDKLKLFKNLKIVEFQDKTISNDLKEKINKSYPNITVNATVTYNFYNSILRDDIENIDLCDYEIDENIANNLSKFKKLKYVKVCDHQINSNAEKIELLNKYPNINFEWNIEIAETKVKNTLEELDLSKKKLNFEEIKRDLILLPNLKKLEMEDCSLTNDELGKLREEYPNIDINWRIYLGKWSLRTDDISFSVMVGKINYKRLTNEDIEPLKYCTKLQALDLGHQGLTDITLIGEYLQNLRILILADNKIKDITPISNLKHLHYIELFVNKIEDLSPLEKCTELIDANIGYNLPIKDISFLLNFKNLERLWIVNGGLTYDQMQLIRNTYPNSKINFAWSLSSTENGWRTHTRYYEMIKMFKDKKYISEEFSKYDNI